MDSEGYIPLSLIASFYRVQALTQDVKLVLDVSRSVADNTIINFVVSF